MRDGMRDVAVAGSTRDITRATIHKLQVWERKNSERRVGPMAPAAHLSKQVEINLKRMRQNRRVGVI